MRFVFFDTKRIDNFDQMIYWVCIDRMNFFL